MALRPGSVFQVERFAVHDAGRRPATPASSPSSMEQRAPGHTVLGDVIYRTGLLDLIADSERALAALDWERDSRAYDKSPELAAMRIAAEAIVRDAPRPAGHARALAAVASRRFAATSSRRGRSRWRLSSTRSPAISRATRYFCDLTRPLQDEIIARTEHRSFRDRPSAVQTGARDPRCTAAAPAPAAASTVGYCIVIFSTSRCRSCARCAASSSVSLLRSPA